MSTHQPASYICPFCSFLSGKENGFNRKEDTVYQNDFATALIAPEWWVNNPGSVLILPNEHREDIYEIEN